MEHWFVYYRLPPVDALAMLPRVRAMMDELALATGVHGRLLRKLGSGTETTLMETYDGIADPAAFEAALSDALARARMPEAIVAARRTERFGDL